MAKYLKVDNVLSGVVESLCAPESYKGVYHQPSFGSPMPSVELLSEIVERLRIEHKRKPAFIDEMKEL